MALSAVDKNKLGKFVRESSIEELYYAAYFDISNRKNKYTDLDLLEYFTDLLNNVFGSKKIITLKLLQKYAISFGLFAEVVKENGDKLDNVLLAKIVSLNEMYQNYIESLGEEKSEDVKKYLDKANELFKEDVDLQLGEGSNSTLEYINRIGQLEDRIKMLEASISSDKKLIESLTKKNEEIKSSGIEKSKALNEAKQELISLKKSLEFITNQLKEKEDELEKLIKEYELLVAENDEQKEKIDYLSKSNAEQKAAIENYEAQISLELSQDYEKKKYDELVQYIIEVISTKHMTAMEILAVCRKGGFDATLSTVKKALFDIEKRYIIRNRNKIIVPQVYRIEKPHILTNTETFLDSKGKDCVDILLVSDLHLNRNSEYIKRIFDKVYSYCSANDIRHIWDAGDFLHNKRVISGSDEFKQIQEFFVENLPLDPRYTYMLLGGNHDKDSICYEGDLLQNICDLKEGMYFLGHKHAFIYFDGHKNDAFVLHHPNSKYEDSLSENNSMDNAYAKGRNSFYSNESRNPNNTFVDIFGHSHFGRIDIINGCIYAPSLTQDRFLDGAYHLKVHFDENRKIKYMTIISLMNKNNSLKTTSVSTYKKLELKL